MHSSMHSGMFHYHEPEAVVAHIWAVDILAVGRSRKLAAYILDDKEGVVAGSIRSHSVLDALQNRPYAEPLWGEAVTAANTMTKRVSIQETYGIQRLVSWRWDIQWSGSRYNARW
ncbi:uncharacterized protein ZBIST_4951 [Zygosaccharomyces bailii]|nr:uncharacterized protein ZBIST_4951 [Zygosaccharomyces bailii]